MCTRCHSGKFLERAHRLVEQCLSGIGLLEPRDCRAAGAAPKALVTSFAVDLEALYEAFLEEVKATLKARGESFNFETGDIDALMISLGADLERIILRAVEAGLSAGFEDAAKRLGVPAVSTQAPSTKLYDSLQAQAINLSEATAAKISGSVKGQLLESVRLGETMTQAMDRVLKISTLSDYEAERICRTELAKAANAARLEGYKGRVTKVRWVLGPAYNGNCACAEMAKVYTLEEAATLPIPLHPNCDCFFEPVLDDDEQTGTGDEAAA
jgi:hypothetical protein